MGLIAGLLSTWSNSIVNYGWSVYLRNLRTETPAYYFYPYFCTFTLWEGLFYILNSSCFFPTIKDGLCGGHVFDKSGCWNRVLQGLNVYREL